MSTQEAAKIELANRLFFRLYQCANMLHKTGSRAVAAEGLTTQQWAVLGALSREKTQGGMSIGDLARYLMVSRQNLSGLISLLKMLENMQRLDQDWVGAVEDDVAPA